MNFFENAVIKVTGRPLMMNLMLEMMNNDNDDSD